MPVSRSLTLLAAATALLAPLLTGCDSSGVDPEGPLPPVPAPFTPPDTLGSADVTPRGTFLRVHEDPGAERAAAVRLDALGIAPGDSVRFLRSGQVDVSPGANALSSDVLAVFSRDSVLAGPGLLARVPGAIEAGRDVVTDSTAIGGLPTDIPQDFRAMNVYVVVPAGATHVFFGIDDSYFSDNEAVGSGLRVTVLRR